MIRLHTIHLLDLQLLNGLLSRLRLGVILLNLALASSAFSTVLLEACRCQHPSLIRDIKAVCTIIQTIAFSFRELNTSRHWAY